MSEGYTEYLGVPSYRRSGQVIALLLLGFALCPPALWAGCLLVLTGDIYENRKDEAGNLTKWGAGNKVAATILLLFQGLLLLRMVGSR